MNAAFCDIVQVADVARLSVNLVKHILTGLQIKGIICIVIDKEAIRACE